MAQTPLKFCQFFKEILKQVDPTLKIEPSDRFYREWISNDRISESFAARLEQNGVSNIDQVNRIVEILTQSKQLQVKFREKLNKNHKFEGKEDSFIDDLTFQLLIHRNYLNRQHTLRRLKEFNIRISDPQIFFTRLDLLIYIGKRDFEQYLARTKTIIGKEFEGFFLFSESDQRSVVEILFAKNIAFHALTPYFQILKIQNSLQIINSLFKQDDPSLNETSILTGSIQIKQEKPTFFLTNKMNFQNQKQLQHQGPEISQKSEVKNFSSKSCSSMFKGLRRTGSLQKTPQDVLGVLDEYDQDAIADLLQKSGIQAGDQRLQGCEVSANSLIRNCINGNLIIPDWQSFKVDIQQIYEEVKKITRGKNADYIPELAEVNPDYFAISICTVDGQIMEFGDTKVPFSAQSCSKPITYCIAVQQNNTKHDDLNVNGQDYVHNFVGRQPSGRNFNDLSLNHQNIPHNPMLNSGAIITVSMIDYTLHPAHRYKLIKRYWERLAGIPKQSYKELPVHIDNSVYLSEKLDANRNWALGYLMQQKKAFQQGKNPLFKREWKKTDLEDNLDLYFQCCSIKVNCTQMAKIGATLANGGICPFTNDPVFDPDNVKNCLSLMYSCGMYDYSGQWSYLVGIPAKSGVSGIIYAVIPHVMCISVYSPPLDHIGNSVKGVEFFKIFTKKFKFHAFDSFVVDSEKKTITKNHAYQKDFKKFLLLEAASRSDIELVRKLIAQKVDINSRDYDERTALHVAVSNKNYDCVRFLIENGADPMLKDRWGNTAYEDALKEECEQMVELFRKKSMKEVSVEQN